MLISNLNPYKEEAMNVVVETFTPIYPNAERAWFEDQVKDIDLFLSLGWLHEGKLVAVYLLQKKNFENLPGNGLCGDALAILPSFRRQGIGSKMLKYLELHSDADYLWGEQDKKLNNLDFWLKTRVLMKEDGEHYYTLQKYNR